MTNRVEDIILKRLDRIENKMDKIDDSFNSWKIRVIGFLTVITAAMQGVVEIFLRN